MKDHISTNPAIMVDRPVARVWSGLDAGAVLASLARLRHERKPMPSIKRGVSTMAHEPEPIDISNQPELLRLVEEVRASGKPRRALAIR